MAKIALGTWAWGAGAFGGDMVFGSKTDVETLKPVFDAAMKAGLSLWDTATAYGMGESERILGTMAKEYERKDVEISTKFTPQIAEVYENSVEKMALASMERMALEQGALSGKYNKENPLPEESDRGKKYNPVLEQLSALTDEMTAIGQKYGASCSQIGIAWAIAKGTLPIIGATKVRHVIEAAEAAKIQLTAEEVVRLEALADATGINTRGGWEHSME